MTNLIWLGERRGERKLQILQENVHTVSNIKEQYALIVGWGGENQTNYHKGRSRVLFLLGKSRKKYFQLSVESCDR